MALSERRKYNILENCESMVKYLVYIYLFVYLYQNSLCIGTNISSHWNLHKNSLHGNDYQNQKFDKFLRLMRDFL